MTSFPKVPLAEVAATCAGGTPSRNRRDYYGGEIPWVKSGEVEGPVITRTQESLSTAGLNTSTAQVLPPGTTLVALYGATAGKVGRLGVSAATNQAVLSVRARDPEDSDYVYYAVQYSAPALLRRLQGGAQPNLSGEMVRDMEIPWPGKDYRKRMAAVLEKHDRVCAHAQSAVAARRLHMDALFDELLSGRRRFPGFTTAWESKRLDEVVSIDPESLNHNTPAGTMIEYIDLGSIVDGVIQMPCQRIKFADAPSRARRVVRHGDVLMSTVRPYLKGFAIVTSSDGDLVASTGFAVLRPSCFADAVYVRGFLLSDLLWQQIGGKLVGSNYPALNSRDVKAIRIPWPSEGERRQLAEAFTAAEQELLLSLQLSRNLHEQKRGVMQRLFTGPAIRR